MSGEDMGTLSQALREPARTHSFLGALKLMETLRVRVARRFRCDPDKAEKPDCGLCGQTVAHPPLSSQAMSQKELMTPGGCHLEGES